MTMLRIDQRRLETWIWVAGGLALGLATVFSLYPYIPTGGDPFGAWYPYVRNWESGGLKLALLNTPSGGKYPGFPLMVRIAMHLSGSPYLDALQYTRVFSVLISFFGCFLALSRFGLKRATSWGLTAFLHLNGIYLGIVTQDLQDAFKPGFFFLSAYFFAGLLRQPKPGSARLRWGAGLLAFSVCACMLSMVRVIDLIPLFFLAGAFCYRERQGGGGWKWKRAALVFAPTAIFVFCLHWYGRNITGQWGFSGGEKPQIWAFKYFEAMGESYSSGHSPLSLLGDAICWPLNHVINRLYYFVEDFIFQAGDMKMIGVYRFVKTLELHGSWLQRAFTLVPAFALAGVIALLATRGLKASRKSMPWIWGGVGGWLFWTFGFNHYEPRYWVLVFACWFVGMALEITEREWMPIALAGSNTLLLTVFWAHLPARIDSSYDQLHQARNWQKEVAAVCHRPNTVLSIPVEYYIWSSYPYFAKQICPGIEIYFPDPGTGKLKGYDITRPYFADQGKGVVTYTKERLEQL